MTFFVQTASKSEVILHIRLIVSLQNSYCIRLQCFELILIFPTWFSNLYSFANQYRKIKICLFRRTTTPQCLASTRAKVATSSPTPHRAWDLVWQSATWAKVGFGSRHVRQSRVWHHHNSCDLAVS